MRAPLIVGLGGTTSDGSATERVLRASLDAAAALGARTRLLAGTDLDLPMYAPGPRGRRARALVEALREADGVILASPAYHGTVSGLVKNALDHAEDLRRADPPYLAGRAVGCIAVAGGAQAGAATLATLRAIGHALRGWPTPLGVVVDTSDRVFDAGGSIDDAVVQGRLDLLADQVVGFARADRRMLAPQSPPVRSGHSRLRTA
jgi:FMN reductase